MKENNKGFTLIELLAVIVILAIIALITTPAILNVVDTARLEGAQDKAWGAISAVKQDYATATMSSSFSSADNSVNFKAASKDLQIGGADLRMSGEMPSDGTITISNNGVITCLLLKFTGSGTYYCTTNTEGTKMCCNTSATNAKVKTNAGCS